MSTVEELETQLEGATRAANILQEKYNQAAGEASELRQRVSDLSRTLTIMDKAMRVMERMSERLEGG